MQQGLKVFVVDDEPVIARTLATILTRFGFAVEFFTAPEEALKVARELRPQLLISDVTMPGLSGVELAILFRAIVPACQILLISGQASTEDLLKTARARGYNFKLLHKPVHPRDLLGIIKTVLPSAPASAA